MTISRVELQGQTLRAQDFTNIKHNEDTRGMVEQSNLAQQTTKSADIKLHHVNDAEHSENRQKKFDAKEEGSNHYQGDGGKDRNKKEQDGKVLLKGVQHGFDIKI